MTAELVIKVSIADDHKILAESLRTFLAGKCEVVGEVSDGRALLKAALELKPDIVLVDIAMPLLNGLEASRQLRVKMPGVKIIFLTQTPDGDVAAEAMRQGASGYVLKTSAGSELIAAIHAAMCGKTFVTPRVARSMEKAFIQDPHGNCKSLDKTLTPRQREVIQLLAEGKSMKQAADILHVSRRTIGFHKYSVMEIMGIGSTAELVQFAIKNRIVIS